MTSGRVARDVELPADPLLLARRIWDQHCPMLLWTQVGDGPSYLACNPIAEASGYDPEPGLPIHPDPDPDASVPRWLGVLPYEDERHRLERRSYAPQERRSPPLIECKQWWRYAAVARIEAGRVRLVADDLPSLEALLAQLTYGVPCSLEADLRSEPDLAAEPLHRARVQHALERIFAGDVYEVNLARRIELTLSGNALAVLDKISHWARAEFAAAFVLPSGAEVVSTSPELFLELEPTRNCTTLPIKGTRPRGVDASEDAALAHELDHDPKERAELAMVVDIERNDLGKVACIGSVRAEEPYVTTHTSVFHRQAQVSAQLLPELGRSELLQAMLPSGSVTGAPKVRAMEIIAELEAERRGLYTGAFGCVTRAGGMKLAMAIRTLCRRGNVAHYFVGGGIVADSDPEREVRETGWKALQVHRALSAR